MNIKKKQVHQEMMQFMNDLLQTDIEQHQELKKLQKEVKQLSETNDTQRKTIKKLRTILKQLIKDINNSKDPLFISLVDNLIKEYGFIFLGLRD